MARYIHYNEKVATALLILYAGGKSLRRIVRDHTTMPARTTINAWRDKYPEFSSAYDRATLAHADNVFDEGYDIVMEADPSEAKLVDVQSKVIASRAAKLNRKDYGEKIDVEVNHKIDIGPVLANAMARLKHISVENPPQIEEAEATVT